MKIIFYSVSGVYTALMAAQIYLGKLSFNSLPKEPELLSLLDLAAQTKEEQGKLFFLGQDQQQNQVYIMGIPKESQLAIRALKSFLNLYGVADKEYRLVNILANNNLRSRLGYQLELLFGTNRLSKKLILASLRANYGQIGRQIQQLGKF